MEECRSVAAGKPNIGQLYLQGNLFGSPLGKGSHPRARAGPHEVLDRQEELVYSLLIATHQLHCVVAVVEGVFPRMQQKRKTNLRYIVLRV